MHGEFLPYDVEVVFLDEFRMMIYIPESTGNPPEFTLFNTFVSQDHPTNFRRFRLPLTYCDCSLSVALDNCISLGMLNQDEPLTIDPTQAFILLHLSNRGMSVIILRIQVLIEQACLMDTDTHIPWTELARDAVVAETWVHGPAFYVQGAHVMEVTPHFIMVGGDGPVCLRTFDLSRRSYNTLRDADDENMQRAWYENGRDFLLEWSGTMVNSVPDPLGNSTFYCLVCGFRRWKAHEG